MLILIVKKDWDASHAAGEAVFSNSMTCDHLFGACAVPAAHVSEP
jgi:hypothetical protein